MRSFANTVTAPQPTPVCYDLPNIYSAEHLFLGRAGDKPYLPKVLTKFHSDVSGDVYLHLVMQDVRTLPASILTQPVRSWGQALNTAPVHCTVCTVKPNGSHAILMQVLQLGPSVFEDVNHPVNYYHNIGENLPAFYFKACRYLGHCDDTSARLFLNQRAESYLPNSTRLYDKFDDWAEWLPWFQPFISCLTDHPVRHPRHPSFANQVSYPCAFMHLGIADAHRFMLEQMACMFLSPCCAARLYGEWELTLDAADWDHVEGCVWGWTRQPALHLLAVSPSASCLHHPGACLKMQPQHGVSQGGASQNTHCRWCHECIPCGFEAVQGLSSFTPPFSLYPRPPHPPIPPFSRCLDRSVRGMSRLCSFGSQSLPCMCSSACGPHPNT